MHGNDPEESLPGKGHDQLGRAVSRIGKRQDQSDLLQPGGEKLHRQKKAQHKREFLVDPEKGGILLQPKGGQTKGGQGKIVDQYGPDHHRNNEDEAAGKKAGQRAAKARQNDSGYGVNHQFDAVNPRGGELMQQVIVC